MELIPACRSEAKDEGQSITALLSGSRVPAGSPGDAHRHKMHPNEQMCVHGYTRPCCMQEAINLDVHHACMHMGKCSCVLISRNAGCWYVPRLWFESTSMCPALRMGPPCASACHWHRAPK